MASAQSSMQRFRSPLLLLALLAVLGGVAAGCGGGGGGGSSSSGVPDGAVAKVGDVTIARAKLDSLVQRAQRSYKLQKRAFPKAGSTDYRALQQQFMQSLVNEAEVQQKADELGVRVTDKQVDDRIKQYKQQSLGGSEKKYTTELKSYGLTQEDARQLFRTQLLSDAVYNKVTGDVKVADKELAAYYKAHPEQYRLPQTREVRHILVKTKPLADTIYSQLKGGADFAALAKKYSTDPSSKDNGGKYTAVKGQSVPEFDAKAFELKTGELSQPVKTQYGYHVIQAMTNTKPAKPQPFAQVKESIRQQLLQQKRSAVISKWADGVRKEFEGKVAYAAGFAPPAAPTTTAGTTTAG
jgi:parvulin-like peptidyl-prolyl isomerase